MVLIGLFMIIEMIVMIVLAFLVFLLFSAISSDNYRPLIGVKPFETQAFFKRTKDNIIQNHVRGIAPNPHST